MPDLRSQTKRRQELGDSHSRENECKCVNDSLNFQGFSKTGRVDITGDFP